MANNLLGYVLISLCVISSLLAFVPTKLRISNGINKINCFENVINEPDLFVHSLTDNSVHSIKKRKTNSLVQTSMKNKSPRPDQRSLVLIFDATESMSTDLPHIQQGVKKITNKLSNLDENPIYNYIFVPYHEKNGTIEIGPTLVTDDKDELLSTLHNIHLNGGGDCPENTLSALIVGLKHALPNSYILIFTDASANDFWLEGEVVELIQRKQATISILLTGYCDNKQNEKYRVLERLAKISNGQVYDIRSDKIDEILSDFMRKIDKHHVLLTAFYAPEADSSLWEFAVDESISKLELMIAGEKAKVWIYSSDGKLAINATETIKLPHVKGYTIDSPSAGIWKIDVDAISAHSVRITVNSKWSFSYGFSIQSPTSMLNTHFFPLNGTKNILTIVSTEKINISEVHLLPDYADQSKLVVLPLNDEILSNTGEYLYETDAFNPPEVPFRILVNGYNEAGIRINRTISTFLHKLNGPAPRVHLNATNLSMSEGETSVLKCAVQSMVPFTVNLMHEQQLLKELQSNDSSTNLIHKIESAELDDKGQYLCIATSAYGSSNQTIDIKVTWVPLPVTIPTIFTVNIPMSNYVAIENQSKIEIPCSVSVASTSSINRDWYINDTKIDFDNNENYMVDGDKLIISNLTKWQSGNYKCTVNVNDETKSASTNLTVQFAPILQQPDNEEIYLHYGNSLNVSCSGYAIPPAISKWKLPNATNFEIIAIPLQIQKFDSSDEGLYECVLDNGIEPAAVRHVEIRGYPPRSTNETEEI